MKIYWKINENYPKGTTFHTTEIDDQDLEDCCDSSIERERFIEECIEEDLAGKITWYEDARSD